MEFAVQHVPDQKDMTYIGMINKGACRQLLIKCYLANGEFQKAKEQADILISQSGYKLMTEPLVLSLIHTLLHGILLINNICKIILCIVLKVKIKQSPCFYRKNKGNCYSLILFSVLRSFAKIRIFFIHPYTFVMQNLWIFCICTLICITLCFICSDSYVM